MRYFILIPVLVLIACDDPPMSYEGTDLEGSPLDASADGPPDEGPPPPGVLTGEDLLRWAAIEEEMLETVGLVPEDSSELLDYLRTQDAVCERHGMTKADYIRINARVEGIRRFLESEATTGIPSGWRADCELARRHRGVLDRIEKRRDELIAERAERRRPR